LPDLKLSGVTWGIGYDAHQTKKSVILQDWAKLPKPSPERLAETQPYYGRSAVEPWKKVRDIIVPWGHAIDVFDNIDVGKWYEACKRTFPGFEDLRPNCQGALVSLAFNRGTSLVGPSRLEMRNIKSLIPKKDYAGIANEFRKMVRVWQNRPDIYNGMKRRRLAEAKLVETP